MGSPLALIIVSMFFSFVSTQSVLPIDYSPPQSCSDTQFYQFGNHSCVYCDTNQVTAGNGLSCVCRNGYIKDIISSRCTACSEISTEDGLFCLNCRPPLTLSNGICSTCGSTSIYVDALPSNQSVSGTRSCVPCPSSTWAGPSKTSCVPCGIRDCIMCTESLVYGGVCFSSSLSPVYTVPSFPYYNQYLTSSIQLCRNGNGTACQLVLNLCVLMGYSRSDPACEEASSTLLLAQPDLVPVLYYPKFGAEAYLSSTVVNRRYSTIASNSASRLVITAAKFALNGSFLGLVNITDDILVCQDRLSHSAVAWRIGAQYEIQCTVDSEELVNNGKDPIFYDLFLYDSADDGGGRLVPLPIHLYNYRNENGDLVNRGSNVNRWQFVRRFFLSQSVTGTPSYARDMHMRVGLKSQGAIQVPFIRIRYSDLPDATPTDVPASFSVLYRNSRNDFNIALGVIASVFFVMAIVYTGIKENGFLRRQGSALCELETILFAVVQCCSVVSTLLLLLLAVASFFVLVLFKGQIELLVALPEGHQEIAFITLLVVAFVFRFISVVYLIWKHVTVQIFLIDWEKPKVHAQQGDTPISIWRSYFVANEWNEIQSLRKIKPIPVLLAVLFFLEIVGLVHLSERDPSSNVTRTSDRYSSPHSLVLRFSLAIILYLVFAVCMRGYLVLIHERFIEHKIQQFVDFCSISNVSVFILSHNLFGHYIHGRSVHGNADTDMKHMNENLIKEQENRCSKRGLIPDTDQQTFEIAVTPKFRAFYNQILAPILAERAQRGYTTNTTSTSQGGSNITEVSLECYQKMNTFLSSVIDHSLPDYDHVVVRKRFLERILGMEFHDAVDRSIFYQGINNSFAQVLFYGNEWTLLSFDILLFCIVDLASSNFILSAIICYLSIKFLQFIRSALGKRNLGRKTMVDNRFLI